MTIEVIICGFLGGIFAELIAIAFRLSDIAKLLEKKEESDE